MTSISFIPVKAGSFNTATNWLSGYVYDAAGNQVTDAQHTYVYDAEGKVVQVDGGTAGMFSYDAMDHRVAISTQAYDHEFLFDPFGRRQSTWLVAQNFGSEGKIYWDYGLLANRGFNGQTTYHHTNYLGTERTRTNYQGLTSATETSGPFGENLNEQNNANLGNSSEDNSQYTGQEHDPESNSEHFQFRQYTSRLGHWMSPDPSSGSLHFGNPQSFNRYAYVLNNPLFYTDPDGTTEDSPCDGANGADCFVGDSPSTDGAGQQASQAPSTSETVDVTTPAPLSPTEIFSAYNGYIAYAQSYRLHITWFPAARLVLQPQTTQHNLESSPSRLATHNASPTLSQAQH